jgi:RNA polymerase sigma-70 factor (ECF subfamily)
VRNVCYTWLARGSVTREFDETTDGVGEETPESLAIAAADRERLARALEGLPARFREVLVLRELEDFSYSDIARIAEIPIGTVMSRLARARGLLRVALTPKVRPLLHTVPNGARGGAKS